MPDLQVSGMRKIAVFIAAAVAILAAAVFLALRQPPDAGDGERLRAAASFYPLAHFIQKAGGDDVAVLNLTPPGIDSHEYEPTPRDIKRVMDSNLFVYLGGGFDAWAERIAPGLRDAGVVTMEIIEVAEMSGHSGLIEAGEEGDHKESGHGSIDPHIWLDPLLSARVVEIIADSLMELDPEYAGSFRENAGDYMAVLQGLHEDYRSGLGSCKKRDIIVSHDAFSYLGKRYGLNVIPVTGVFSGGDPSPKRIAAVAGLMRRKGIGYIFMEPLANPAVARTISRETGARVLTLNPIEGLTVAEERAGMDYVSIMRENLDNLRKALDCG